jgi:hypothetical protein
MLKSEETGLVGSELAGIARKTVSSASQTIVNILKAHGTSLQPAEAADKLRELEDNIWEKQKCINNRGNNCTPSVSRPKKMYRKKTKL